MDNPKSIAELIRILCKKCPYDREMTFEKIIPDLLGEAHELVEALATQDASHVQEELGDTLFQLYFIGALLSPADENLTNASAKVIEKMVRRHPHVFGATTAETVADVKQNWQKIKSAEPGRESKSVLEGVPQTLPALQKAQQISSKMAHTGFDWDNINHVLDQLTSEIREFSEAYRAHGKGSTEVTLEIGDILFTIVNLARFSDVSAEGALLKTLSKVKHRFQSMEKTAIEEGKSLSQYSMEELESLWQKAKQTEGPIS